MGLRTWFNRLLDRMKLDPPEPRRASLAERAYAAAGSGHLMSSWTTAATTADREIRDSLAALRARSRQLARDTPQGRRFLSLCAVNVVGPEGITLQNQARRADTSGDLDVEANQRIEDAWREWSSSREASLDGESTFIDQESMQVQSLAQDGETFCEKIRIPRTKYGFTLRWYEPDQLPESYNEDLGRGRRISMSIQKDAVGRPKFYHVLMNHPGDTQEYENGRKMVIPADRMIHVFIKQRPTQSRGVPWMHAVMANINMRAGYQEAALVNARVGAAKMGFYKTDTSEALPGEKRDGAGNPIQKARPGHIEILPDGVEFQGWDPTYPSGDYEPFTKAQDHDISSGLNLSYHSLTGNLTDVNYSSIRAGTLEERDMWRYLQRFTASHFCTPVFSEWLFMALLMGAIPGYGVEDYERLNRPTWEVRGWEWVDPMKEIQASILAINAGLSTRTIELSKRGLDLDDVFRQLSSELELASKYNLKLKTETAPSKTPKGTSDEDQD